MNISVKIKSIIYKKKIIHKTVTFPDSRCAVPLGARILSKFAKPSKKSQMLLFVVATFHTIRLYRIFCKKKYKKLFVHL